VSVDWPQLCTTLTPTLKEIKRARFHLDLSNLVRERRALIADLYAIYQRNIPVDEPPYLPAATTVFGFEDIDSLIYSEPSLQPEVLASQVTLLFPKLVKPWVAEKKFNLARLISPNGHRFSAVVSSVDLISRVFKCSIHPVCLLFGAADVLSHDSGTELRTIPTITHPIVQYSPKGEEAMLRLLKSLKLDPATTTLRMLDRLNPTVVCTACVERHFPNKKPSKVFGRKAFVWRSVVSPYFARYGDTTLTHAFVRIKLVEAVCHADRGSHICRSQGRGQWEHLSNADEKRIVNVEGTDYFPERRYGCFQGCRGSKKNPSFPLLAAMAHIKEA